MVILSDVALRSMVTEATANSLPHPLMVDDSVLRLSPAFDGPQHDESGGIAYRFGARAIRDPNIAAPLHVTVYDRYAAHTVLKEGVPGPYRPEALKNHPMTRQPAPPPPGNTVPASTRGPALPER